MQIGIVHKLVHRPCGTRSVYGIPVQNTISIELLTIKGAVPVEENLCAICHIQSTQHTGPARTECHCVTHERPRMHLQPGIERVAHHVLIWQEDQVIIIELIICSEDDLKLLHIREYTHSPAVTR